MATALSVAEVAELRKLVVVLKNQIPEKPVLNDTVIHKIVQIIKSSTGRSDLDSIALNDTPTLTLLKWILELNGVTV